MTEEERERRRAAEAYFGVAGGPQDGQPRARAARKEPGAKTVSAFTVLRTALENAASVAEYVRECHGNAKTKKGGFFNDAKATNMFLQAVSNQPDTLYAELFGTYKSEVNAILERLFSLFSVSRVAMTPAAHEFLIHCEQHGVRSAEWGASGIKPLEEGAAPSLLLPRDMLKRLIGIEPIPRLQRQIELGSTIADIAKCTSKLDTLQAKADAPEEDEDRMLTMEDDDAIANPTGVPSGADLDYAQRCQVISKIVSKARRLLTVADKEAPVSNEAVPAPLAGEGGATAAPQEGTGAEKSAQPKAKSEPALVPLTAEEREMVRTDIVHKTIEMLLRTLERRPPGSMSTPISKVLHFAEWCLANDLITQVDHDTVGSLKEKTNEDLEAQTVQLETVMKLKELGASDDEGLRAIADQLWAEGEEGRLEPNSLDVLSALAVAATPETISDDVKKVVFDRLVVTQQYFHAKGNPIHVPRRTMRFLNNVRNKERDAAISKLKEEAAAATGGASERAAPAVAESDSDNEE